MPDTLLDGNYIGPSTDGAPRWQWPFRVNGDLVSAFFEQDYWQTLATFTPQKWIIPHELYSDFYLVKESEPQSLDALVVKFTRTFARIPVTQTAYGTTKINKPLLSEFATAFNGNGVTGAGTSSTVTPCYDYISHMWDGQNNRVYGPYITTTSANNGANTRVTWPSAHGITTQRFMIKSSGNRYIFNSGDYTVVDTTNIDLLGWLFGANATQAGKYLRDYTSGPGNVVTKNVGTFYLPGITSGITTPADVTMPAPLLNDAAFLAAVVATLSGFLNYDLDGFGPWMDSSIYRLDAVQINMASL